MAVYFDSTADIIGATSGGAIAGNVESRTLCGFARIESNTATNQYVCSFSDSLSYISASLQWRSTGDSMFLIADDAGTPVDVSFASRPAVGEPFFWYLKCSGTGADQLEAGWGLLDGSAMVTVTSTLKSGAEGAVAIVALGGAVANHMSGQMAGVRQWTTALSADELEIERYHLYATQQRGSLIGEYPMWDVATSLTDFSGNGATLENLGGFGGTAPSDTAVSFPARVRARRAGRAVFAPAGGGATPRVVSFGGKMLLSVGRLLRIA